MRTIYRMVTMLAQDDVLQIRFTRLEKVLGLLRDQTIPIAAVRSVGVDADGLRAVRGLRAPGFALPGRRRIGTWRGRHTTMVSVRAGRPALHLTLEGASFDEVVLDVPDADALAAALEPRVDPAGGRGSREVEVAFPARGRELHGSLLLPDGDSPAVGVLMLAGSGPLDRNSNHRRMRFDVTRILAEDLARRGIASLRFDKHGVGQTEGDWRSAGLEDNIADARAALGWLAVRPEIDPRRLFVAGHSEGALIAARLLAEPHEAAPRLAGGVLLSMSAQPGSELLTWQARQVTPTLPGPVRVLLKVLRVDPVAKVRANHARVLATTGDVERLSGVRVNAKWLRELLRHRPADDLARIDVPLLALTGTKDLQVDPADLEDIRRLTRGDTRTVAVPDLTHTLRRQPGAASLSRYRAELRAPVDPEVVALVGDWVADHAGLRSATAPLRE